MEMMCIGFLDIKGDRQISIYVEQKETLNFYDREDG